MKVVGWMSLLGAVGLAVGLGGSVRAEAEPYGGTASAPANAPQPVLPDASITADVQARLEQVRALRQAQVTIATKDGVVTLVGTIPNEFARTQALDAARATPGVVRVDDKLRLDISSPQAPSRN